MECAPWLQARVMESTAESTAITVFPGEDSQPHDLMNMTSS